MILNLDHIRKHPLDYPFPWSHLLDRKSTTSSKTLRPKSVFGGRQDAGGWRFRGWRAARCQGGGDVLDNLSLLNL